MGVSFDLVALCVNSLVSGPVQRKVSSVAGVCAPAFVERVWFGVRVRLELGCRRGVSTGNKMSRLQALKVSRFGAAGRVLNVIRPEAVLAP